MICSYRAESAWLSIRNITASFRDDSRRRRGSNLESKMVASKDYRGYSRLWTPPQLPNWMLKTRSHLSWVSRSSIKLQSWSQTTSTTQCSLVVRKWTNKWRHWRWSTLALAMIRNRASKRTTLRAIQVMMTNWLTYDPPVKKTIMIMRAEVIMDRSKMEEIVVWDR